MITQLLMDFGIAVIGWFADLIPDSWTPPEWFRGTAEAVGGLFDAASTMGVWIPLDFAFLCAWAVMSTYIGGGVVKAIRILVSHVTGGGGSAG